MHIQKCCAVFVFCRFRKLGFRLAGRCQTLCVLLVVAQGPDHAADKMLLAVYIDPVDAAVVLQLLKLFLCELRINGSGLLQGLLIGNRVVRRKSTQNFALHAKLGFKILVDILLQPFFNQTSLAFKITELLAAFNIGRKGSAKCLQILVTKRFHTASFLSAFDVGVKSWYIVTRAARHHTREEHSYRKYLQFLPA